MNRFFLSSLLVVLTYTICFSQSNEVIYTSNEFTISRNSVKQGKYTSTAFSPTNIKSDYQSPTTEKFTDVLQFKFSINNKDNELPVGINHNLKLKCVPGQAEEVIVTFGSKELVTPVEKDITKKLPANTKLKIKVDFSPVLKDFKEKGFYQTFTGEKIYKNDFKRLCVAGDLEPLSWDFENLHGKGLELHDKDNDGVYEAEITLNAFDPNKVTANEWKLENDISVYPQLKSGSVMIDAIYNMSLDETKKNIEKDGTFRTGKEWSGVWTRDLAYSVLLGIAAIEPEVCKTGLMRKVKRKRIIQDTGTGGAWPVSSDRVIWAVAAYEVYKVTGEEAWLNQIYEIIKNSLEDDQKTLMDYKTSLMRGESSFLDWRKQTYPEWMNSADIYSSYNLGTNAAHFQAYKVLSEISGLMKNEADEKKYNQIAEKIKAGINKNLWLSDKGYYGQYIYGREFQTLSPRSESLGEALCMLYGVASEEQKKSIIEKAPELPFGVSCIFPQITGISAYHNNAIWPFVQAFWNLAVAKEDNNRALEQGLAAYFRPAALFLTNKENFVAETGDFRDTEINSDRQLWSVSASLGMIYKLLFGMDFQADKLSFAPSVPAKYGDKIVLNNFKYRGSILNISITGNGNKVKTFKLDGKILENAEIPGNLTGNHSVEIVLNNLVRSESKINLIPNAFAPATPIVSINGNVITWPKVMDASGYVVYVNGTESALITALKYGLNNTEKAIVVQVKAINSKGLESFLSAPVYYGNDQSIFIEAEKFATKSVLPYKGYSGEGFIELTREKNRVVSIKANVPEEGEYILDFKYSNGSGPYNTENKCAIRSIYLNNNYEGVAVLPQIGQDEWSNFGYSNLFRVKLKKGENKIELRFDEHNENMNVDVNTAMLDGVRIRKIE